MFFLYLYCVQGVILIWLCYVSLGFYCLSFRFALDLYKSKLLDIDLPFSNPFSQTTMMTYNPRLQASTYSIVYNKSKLPLKLDCYQVLKF